MNMKELYEKYENYIIVTVATVLFGGILFGTGTIFSGWHLVDDHETVKIVELYRNSGVSMGNAIADFLLTDMRQRWRPLYWVLRVFEAYAFGWNSVIPNILLCVQGIITYVLLYKAAGYLSCNALFSHAFAAMIIVGRQFEIWYRIANQENVGLFFLAITLFLLTGQIPKREFQNRIRSILIVLSGILCSCMKESFVLILPALMILKVGMEWTYGGEASLIKVTLKNWKSLCCWAVTLFFHLFMILRFSGVNTIDYAGIDTKWGIKDYIWNILRMCKGSLKVYVLLAVALCVVTLWSLFCRNRGTGLKMVVVMLFAGGEIVAAQLILHAKSDMWDRYLVPAVVGYGLLFVIGLNGLLRHKWQRYLAGVFYIALFLFEVITASVPMSQNYAKEGQAVKELYRIVLQNTEEYSSLISELCDAEKDMALGIFLELQGRPYVYVYNEDTGNYEDAFGQKRPLEESDETIVYITRPDVQGRFAPGVKDNRDFYNIDDRYYIYISNHR